MKPQALWPLEGEVIGKYASDYEINGRKGTSYKVQFFFDKRYGAVMFKVTEEFYHQLPPVDKDGVYPEHEAVLNFGVAVRNNVKSGRDGDGYAKLEPELQFISGTFTQPRSGLDSGLMDQVGAGESGEAGRRGRK